ncbi:carbamoyl-phosphate synthase large subunit [Anaeromicrobium sediminis]|uniref:Carbamoyl phosphate synthase large chain n=1 Tax=Anaeromicrobium sediminis TaxID=1478221 RepID=A0A267MPL5_9FIRM|nr:carbamoyl-phosphate synthase large subunit [Anaeromicrobium sediminis]PAB60670.1 carbamoyl phosphate synthase large subunit [Anaeromicrobium sediminis]
MPKNEELKKVIVIGSGPIVIGQGAEFDYAGTQACKALKEENIQVVLINSNPATIMTDENVADKVYIEPLTVDVIEEIIKKEKPQGLIPTLGGQTALNLAVELVEKNILKKYNVKLLGTSLESIKKAEDRELFKKLMNDIDEPICPSKIISSIDEAMDFVAEIGFPIIVRPAYTLGGTGGGIAYDMDQLKDTIKKGILHSKIGQVLLEKSVYGWKEIEYEVMRDSNDTAIVVCNMENMDPVGIHTGDSIVVAPSQTLSDKEYHMLRKSSIKIIKALKIEGGCNVQFALDTKSSEYVVIEVNPRVSRSSALASKATAYPIAKIAAKIAIGYDLHEIPNYVTKTTKAAFEPSLDYVVTKMPKWPFDKFSYANRKLGTQMKATGEVMAIDRNFESSLLKAVSSLEGEDTALRRKKFESMDETQLIKELENATDERIFVIGEALRRNMSIESINHITKIDKWFLCKIDNIIQMENKLKASGLELHLLKKAQEMGFTDKEIINLTGEKAYTIDILRRAHDIYPVYKMVDTCSAEFKSDTPYYYSTYDKEDDNIITEKEKIIVVGSGAIRIGQGIEFDYCSVHSVKAIKDCGYEAIMINNNPETVSTDFDVADKLYFEPLFIEDVINVIKKEKPKGVILQFGGQTSINLANGLMKRGVSILGTSVESINVAEDRYYFGQLLEKLQIPQPKGAAVSTVEEAKEVAKEIGYPLIIRPSYVIGGRSMDIIRNEEQLCEYMKEASEVSKDYKILIDQYIEGKEVEIDAICDGKDILIPGIMEHIEPTGVHSGDSISVYPAMNISSKVKGKIVEYSKKIGKALGVVGLMNIQFVIKDENVYIIEVNPRSSRTVPILSKVTSVPMIDLAVKTILGKSLKKLSYGIGLLPDRDMYAVKMPVFSFQKLDNVDVALTPEMKSTGEVLGVDKTYEKALIKAFKGALYDFPKEGKILVSLNKRSREEAYYPLLGFAKLGFKISCTEGTYEYYKEKGLKVNKINVNTPEEIKKLMDKGEINIVLNTPNKGKDKSKRGFVIRSMAHQYKIPTFTNVYTFKSYLDALKEYYKDDQLEYNTIDYYR